MAGSRDSPPQSHMMWVEIRKFPRDLRGGGPAVGGFQGFSHLWPPPQAGLIAGLIPNAESRVRIPPMAGEFSD
ncbi:MAG: hypothetical protein JSU77_13750, partial [Fidelibacterota bacterium]